MNRSWNSWICVLAGLLVFAFGLAPATAIPVVKAQKSCHPEDLTAECLTFRNTDTLGVIRSFSFTAPSAGTAIIDFHGSMVCSSDTVFRVVDFVSAIVTSQSAAVSASIPSGARHAAAFTSDGGWTEDFNLDSTLVSRFTQAGKRSFHFKLSRQRQDDGTKCTIHNAAFTIEFLHGVDGKVVTQSPCTASGGYCFKFGANDALVNFNAISFNAPGKGSALVTFHGTLYCTNNTNSPQTVDIDSQIVQDTNTTANAGNPGGLRMAMVLASKPGEATSRSFNLASTRVFAIPKKGSHSYLLKFNRNTMGASTQCFLYNAVFTVRFTPATATTEIVAQTPCKPINSSCGTTHYEQIYRRIKIVPTRNGTAVISFHGSLACKSSDGQIPNLLLYTSQLFGPEFYSGPEAPGGLEHGMFIDPKAALAINLKSTAAFKLQKNKPLTIYLKQGGSNDDTSHAVCRLYNASFTARID